MTNTTNNKHYRVRKEIVWCSLAGLLALGTYQAWDWWAHLNWPPHEIVHLDRIKTLNCHPSENEKISKEQMSYLPKETMNSSSINRNLFFQYPECIAGIYLAYEGSRLRYTQYVYDTEKKRRTATIVTTFDKYEGE